MAGAIFAVDGQAWTASSWWFYWAIETLAVHVADTALTDRLNEIAEHHLGGLSVEDLAPDQRQDLYATAARLPAIARAERPDAGEAFYTQIDELAALLRP